jgi:DNA-binding NarL/FixJ family response regulator
VSRTIRTLILASSEPLRQALRDLLLVERDFELLGVAATRHEAKNLARLHHPDLLVYALEPVSLSRLLFLREVEAASPRTHVFFCSLHHEALDDLKRRASGNGANRPSAFARDLVSALRPLGEASDAAGDGDGPGAGSVGSGNAVREALSCLTPREREVLRMAAEGLSSTETGRQLGISARTAECHRAHGMRKLGLHRRAELVRFAVSAGLVGDRRDLR